MFSWLYKSIRKGQLSTKVNSPLNTRLDYHQEAQIIILMKEVNPGRGARDLAILFSTI